MSLNYEIHKANSAIELYESVVVGSTNAVHTGTFTSAAVREPTIRQKTRGGWVGIVLTHSTVDESWWIEKMAGYFKSAGRLKV